MKVNIADLDKAQRLSLFIKLYNHIKKHTGDDKGTDEEALKLLIESNYDYAHLTYCNLSGDEVDPSIFNNNFGDGENIFQEYLTEVRKQMKSSAEVKTRLEPLQTVSPKRNPVSLFLIGTWNSVTAFFSDVKKSNSLLSEDQITTNKLLAFQFNDPHMPLSDVSKKLIKLLQDEVALYEGARTQVGSSKKIASQLALEETINSVISISTADRATIKGNIYLTMESVKNWYKEKYPDTSFIPLLMDKWWLEMSPKLTFEPLTAKFKME